MARAKNQAASALAELRAFGLTFPEAHTKSSWEGHLDLAVRNKTFAFMSGDGQPLSVSCKLPHSNEAALMLPFASATGYGLGKSGWVSAAFDQGEAPPLEVLKAWLDESYRAVAPKKLVAALGVPSAKLANSAQAAQPSRAAKPSKPAKKPAKQSGRAAAKRR
jgi:predicted DNA-binding protein (MmcQ/YjbR family)